MSRYFNIVITGGTSPGPYSVYYDFVDSNHLTSIYPSTFPATGLSSTLSYTVTVPDWDCPSGYTFVADPTQPNGIGYCSNGGCPPNTQPAGGGICQGCLTPCPNPEPTSISSIIIYNEICDTYQTFDVGVIPYPGSCFCLRIDQQNPFSLFETIANYEFCPNSTYHNGKPVYTTTISSTTYYLKWNSTNSYWEINDGGLPQLPIPANTVIRSSDINSLPLSSWVVYGVSVPGQINLATATSGVCPVVFPTLSPMFTTVFSSSPFYNMICVETNPTCFDKNDGSIVSTATGGAGGWLYSLDGVMYTNSTGVFNQLYAGPYTVYAMDISGTVTSCNVNLTAPQPITIQLPITLTEFVLSNTIGNMNYYQSNVVIDTTLIPDYLSVTFDYELNYLLSYVQPGSVTFDTLYHSLIVSTSAQTFDNTSPLSYMTGSSSCSPTVYKKYTGNDIYTVSGVTISNTDSIVGSIIIGIDTNTDGQLQGSCYTTAYVTATANIKNIVVTPVSNVNSCTTILPSTNSINKIQTVNLSN